MAWKPVLLLVPLRPVALAIGVWLKAVMVASSDGWPSRLAASDMRLLLIDIVIVQYQWFGQWRKAPQFIGPNDLAPVQESPDAHYVHSDGPNGYNTLQLLTNWKLWFYYLVYYS